MRLALALSSAALIATATGCTAGATPEASPTQVPGVPAGVAAQYATVEKEIAAEGGQTTSGEWRIAYIVEEAEPWHEIKGESHSHRTPAAGETHHIEIIPFEASSGRIVPDVPIKLAVVDAAGATVEEKPLAFLYGEFFHYANNFTVPKPGKYTLRASVGVPPFARHGEANQRPPLTAPATVEFPGVSLD